MLHSRMLLNPIFLKVAMYMHILNLFYTFLHYLIFAIQQLLAEMLIQVSQLCVFLLLKQFFWHWKAFWTASRPNIQAVNKQSSPRKGTSSRKYRNLGMKNTPGLWSSISHIHHGFVWNMFNFNYPH